MIANPHTVEVSAPASEALHQMRRFRVHHLPVVQQGRLVGLLCDRDLDRSALRNAIPGARGPDPQPLLVDEVMRANTVTVTEHATLEEAALQMLHSNQSALPVVDECGQLVGLISAVDLLCAAFGVQRRATATLN